MGSEQTASKPRPKPSPGGTPGLLPPPPGGIKIAGPPRTTGRSSPSQQSASVVPPSAATANYVSKPATGSNSNNDLDFLLDLGGSSGSSQENTQQSQHAFQQSSIQPVQAVDPWGDFTG